MMTLTSGRCSAIDLRQVGLRAVQPMLHGARELAGCERGPALRSEQEPRPQPEVGVVGIQPAVVKYAARIRASERRPGRSDRALSFRQTVAIPREQTGTEGGATIAQALH